MIQLTGLKQKIYFLNNWLTDRSVNVKTPKFYISPKIHKENNPGRPVINSINCHTSEISRFVDHHLQPLVREIPSYIKDTNDFINKIDNFAVPPNSFLVTMDVKSLYTSIPNNEGIASVKKKYDHYPNKTIPTKIITTFLALILTLNNFIFNSKFYLQIKGCAMGTICTPSYANIIMSECEEEHIYPLIKNKSVIYLRYIDNIFMVWIKSESELRHFMNEINQKHQSIKFDFKFSKESIEFLDTLVYIDSKNRLQTTLYKKPTDCQNYLHAKSAHPFSLKKSIPYSQALRIKRICSTFEEYRKHSQDLIKRFVEKGYNESTVRKQIERVDHLDRSLLLKHCKPKLKDSIPFSVTYNSVLPNIKEIINKHWHILNIDSSFKEIFNSSQLMIAFRKNTSLKQLIGTNTIRNNQKFLTPTQTTTAGQCTPCYTSRSLCCQQVLKTTTFTSTQTRETFTIFHQVTCHSNYVIYLLECIMCKIQYVGKSETSFNIRLNNHRKDIKKPNAIEPC